MAGNNLVYRGQKEICAAVGVNWKHFSYYVNKHDLPVFRITPKGQWLATPDDLKEWIEKQKENSVK